MVVISGLFITYGCGKKKTGEEVSASDNVKYVMAAGGLRMRDAASAKGKKLGTIPEETAVEVIEETGKPLTISDKTGKWTKVKWDGKEGWVFGGFLVTKKELEETKKKHPLLRSIPDHLVKAVMVETNDPNNPVDYGLEENCTNGNPIVKFYQQNGKNMIAIDPNVLPPGAAPGEVIQGSFIIQSIKTESEPSMMGPDGRPEKFLVLYVTKDASAGAMPDSFPEAMTVRILSMGDGLYEFGFSAPQELHSLEQAFYIDEKKKNSLKKVPCQNEESGYPNETGGGPGDETFGPPDGSEGMDPYNDAHSNDAPM